MSRSHASRAKVWTVVEAGSNSDETARCALLRAACPLVAVRSGGLDDDVS
jgi:hypothetical protein